MTIRITAKQDGFRRGGKAHSKNSIDWKDDAFTETQLEELQAEPLLTVEIIEGEPEGNVDEQKEEKIASIVEAINNLPPDDMEVWTGDGKPQVSALEKILEIKITASERDQAMEIFAKDQG